MGDTAGKKMQAKKKKSLLFSREMGDFGKVPDSHALPIGDLIPNAVLLVCRCCCLCLLRFSIRELLLTFCVLGLQGYPLLCALGSVCSALSEYLRGSQGSYF